MEGLIGSSTSSVIHSINILAPCNLSKIGSNVSLRENVLQCSLNCAVGRIEIASLNSNMAKTGTRQLHMVGWSGLFETPAIMAAQVGVKNWSMPEAPNASSIKTQVILDRSNNISHLPSLLAWLPRGSLRSHKNVSLPSSQRLLEHRAFSRPRGQSKLPSSIANLSMLPSNFRGQPGGHIIHPAILDAATHTAAALANKSDTSGDDEGKIMCEKFLKVLDRNPSTK